MSVERIRYRERVKTSDRKTVRRIVESSGFFSSGEIKIAVELVGERLLRGTRSGYFFLFVEIGGDVTGYSCFGPIAGTLTSYDLYWIAVEDGCRGTGIGGELLTKTEEKIAKRGGRRIYVETSSRTQYEPTRSFYERSGYRGEAILKDFYAPGDDKIMYVKEIRALPSSSPSPATHMPP